MARPGSWRTSSANRWCCSITYAPLFALRSEETCVRRAQRNGSLTSTPNEPDPPCSDDTAVIQCLALRCRPGPLYAFLVAEHRELCSFGHRGGREQRRQTGSDQRTRQREHAGDLHE